jgi:hypothetical protein
MSSLLVVADFDSEGGKGILKEALESLVRSSSPCVFRIMT